MAGKRLWSRARGGNFGTNNWYFSGGSLIEMMDVTGVFLNPGQTVLRTLLDVWMTVNVPTAVAADFLEPVPFITSMLACTNVCGTNAPVWADPSQSDENPSGIVSTGQLYPVSQALSATGKSVTTIFGLRETLDSHGQRKVLASEGEAMVTSTMFISDTNGLMAQKLGVSMSWACYLRALIQQDD